MSIKWFIIIIQYRIIQKEKNENESTYRVVSN